MESKSEIRTRLLARRRALSLEEARKRSALIRARLYELEVFQGAGRVLTYVSSKDNEVDTAGIISDLLAQGRDVACPRAGSNGTLTWCRLSALSALVPGKFGVLEPAPGCTVIEESEKSTVVLVPGIAFTTSGDRLGYGRGYFDRFLASHPGTAIGLAYALQIVPALPQERHDVQVDLVVTEEAVYLRRCP